MPSIEAVKPAVGNPKPFSISFNSKSKPHKSLSSSTQNPKKRPHSALADPDSDDEHTRTVHAEEVVGFDSGNAVIISSNNTANAPLIIKSEKNRDWQEESRRKRGKNILPAEAQAAQNGNNGSKSLVERAEVSLEGGLKFVSKQSGQAEAEVPVSDGTQTAKPTATADEEALAALLGAKKESTLSIPSQDTQALTNGHDSTTPEDFPNEEARFRADLASRPEAPTLSDFAAVPIEEFGPAMLRGMGWTEGTPIGKRKGSTAQKPKEVQRRPALLGIGAKEVPGGTEELDLGAWGGGRGKGRGKEKVLYSPVALRNSVTGEVITEEEKKLRDAQTKTSGQRERDGAKVEEESWKERRDRNLARDQETKRKRLLPQDETGHKEMTLSRREGSTERPRDKRRDHEYSRRERSRSRDRNTRDSSKGERSRDGGKSRHGSSRRERSRSMERKHRKRDYESERDYDRRKDGGRRR